MRFRTRAFLCCFVPFALLLASSFWMIQGLVQSQVREGLRNSLLENHRALALALSKSDLQSKQFLKVVGENAALKAGVQLLLMYPNNADARRTVEDQLHELCTRMGFALLTVSGPDGAPLAGVAQSGGQLAPLDMANVKIGRSGLTPLNGLTYQVRSVPLDLAEENIGSLTVGEIFDFSQFTTPTVLLRNGHVVKSSIAGMAPAEAEAAMSQCAGTADCNVQLRGVNYISLPMQSVSFGDGYLVRSLQNLDSAVAPVQAYLRRVFGGVALLAVLVAMVVGMVSAGSIVRPIATVVKHLQEAERTGGLTEFHSKNSPVLEMRRLIESFNRAAVAVREGREHLTLAYVEFVQSLASALDARDRYTAGHSHRVSEMSSAVARDGTGCRNGGACARGRAAARHWKDWRAGRRVAQTWKTDTGRIRTGSGTPGHRATHSGRRAWLLPVSPRGGTAPRELGRNGVSAWALRPGDTSGCAHHSCGGCL